MKAQPTITKYFSSRNMWSVRKPPKYTSIPPIWSQSVYNRLYTNLYVLYDDRRLRTWQQCEQRIIIHLYSVGMNDLIMLTSMEVL
jgi:hypothetical protein